MNETQVETRRHISLLRLSSESNNENRQKWVCNTVRVEIDWIF